MSHIAYYVVCLLVSGPGGVLRPHTTVHSHSDRYRMHGSASRTVLPARQCVCQPADRKDLRRSRGHFPGWREDLQRLGCHRAGRRTNRKGLRLGFDLPQQGPRCPSRKRAGGLLRDGSPRVPVAPDVRWGHAPSGQNRRRVCDGPIRPSTIDFRRLYHGSKCPFLCLICYILSWHCI